MVSPAPKAWQVFSRRVLVVDDNLDNVRSLAMLFQTMGHYVDYAINATAAVDLAVLMKPEVIFLDLLLPDGHGADVCIKLRSHSALSEIRIFAVTASNRVLDLHLALDAGCNDVLRKPVLPDTYERLITGGLSRRKLRDSFPPRATSE